MNNNNVMVRVKGRLICVLATFAISLIPFLGQEFRFWPKRISALAIFLCDMVNELSRGGGGGGNWVMNLRREGRVTWTRDTRVEGNPVASSRRN